MEGITSAQVVCLEPSFHLGTKPRITPHTFKVDFAFGAEDDNDTVYKAVATPLLELALRVRARQ